MKVKLYKITVEPTEVELPDTCPHCEEPVDSTMVGGFELAGRTLVNGIVGLTDGSIQWGDGLNEYEPNYLVGIHCGECNGILIDLLDQQPETWAL